MNVVDVDLCSFTGIKQKCFTENQTLFHSQFERSKCVTFKTFFNMFKFFMQYLQPANEVWGKVMFLHLSVILFTGGVYPSMQWDRRFVTWECVTRWGVLPVVHPKLGSTSERYASYWNAFLYIIHVVAK